MLSKLRQNPADMLSRITGRCSGYRQDSTRTRPLIEVPGRDKNYVCTEIDHEEEDKKCLNQGIREVLFVSRRRFSDSSTRPTLPQSRIRADLHNLLCLRGPDS